MMVSTELLQPLGRGQTDDFKKRWQQHLDQLALVFAIEYITSVVTNITLGHTFLSSL
jgi:hypothetical protein